MLQRKSNGCQQSQRPSQPCWSPQKGLGGSAVLQAVLSVVGGPVFTSILALLYRITDTSMPWCHVLHMESSPKAMCWWSSLPSVMLWGRGGKSRREEEVLGSWGYTLERNYEMLISSLSWHLGQELFTCPHPDTAASTDTQKQQGQWTLD